MVVVTTMEKKDKINGLRREREENAKTSEKKE